MCLSVSLLLLGLSPQETSMAPSFADLQSGEVSFSPGQSEARLDYGHALQRLHSCHVILHWFKFLHDLGIKLYANKVWIYCEGVDIL